MRDILFRGKDINGNWVKGHYCLDNFDIPSIKRSGFDNFKPVKKETVGQYSGINDSEGNEIFEGDIIKVFYEDSFISNSVVFFKNGQFVYQELFASFDVIKGRLFPLSMDNESKLSAKVIGNIYDSLPDKLSMIFERNKFIDDKLSELCFFKTVNDIGEHYYRRRNKKSVCYVQCAAIIYDKNFNNIVLSLFNESLESHMKFDTVITDLTGDELSLFEEKRKILQIIRGSQSKLIHIKEC